MTIERAIKRAVKLIFGQKPKKMEFTEINELDRRRLVLGIQEQLGKKFDISLEELNAIGNWQELEKSINNKVGE